jgi:hypothetical protein
VCWLRQEDHSHIEKGAADVALVRMDTHRAFVLAFPVQARAMISRHFRIRNWERFQHYKQRNPPWIRLHRTLLRDHTFTKLTEGEQWSLVRLWLLASESDNSLAYDEKWVRRAIGASRRVPLEKYLAMGFIELEREQDASNVLASRGQDAEPEAEGSEGTEDSEQSRFGEPAEDSLEGVERILVVCHDADEGTEKVLRSYLPNLAESDVACAIEQATGPGVRSPTKVAVAYLKKQSEGKLRLVNGRSAA